MKSIFLLFVLFTIHGFFLSSSSYLRKQLYPPYLLRMQIYDKPTIQKTGTTQPLELYNSETKGGTAGRATRLVGFFQEASCSNPHCCCCPNYIMKGIRLREHLREREGSNTWVTLLSDLISLNYFCSNELQVKQSAFLMLE